MVALKDLFHEFTDLVFIGQKADLVTEIGNPVVASSHLLISEKLAASHLPLYIFFLDPATGGIFLGRWDDATSISAILHISPRACLPLSPSLFEGLWHIV